VSLIESAKWWVIRIPLASTAETPSSLACQLESVITEVVEATDLHAGTWPRAGCMRRVAAKHGHP